MAFFLPFSLSFPSLLFPPTRLNDDLSEVGRREKIEDISRASHFVESLLLLEEKAFRREAIRISDHMSGGKEMRVTCVCICVRECCLSLQSVQKVFRAKNVAKKGDREA